MGALREFWACVAVAAIMTAIAAFFGLTDPMGLDEATDQHSAGVVARFMAPDYGGQSPDTPPRATVVEVRDSTLLELGFGWPPSRGFYSDVILTLAREKPSAIFLDYMLVSGFDDQAEKDRFIKVVDRVTKADQWQDNEACWLSPLARLQCIVGVGGVPVIVGKSFMPDECSPSSGAIAPKPDFIAQDKVALMVPLGWTELPNRYRPIINRSDYDTEMDALYGRDEALRLRERCALIHQTWTGSQAYDLSPALALFAVQCLKEQKLRNANETPSNSMNKRARALCAGFVKSPLDKSTPPPDLKALGLPPLTAITWGSRPEEGKGKLDTLFYRPDDQSLACEKETNSFARRMAVGWKQFTSALGDNTAAVRVPCPYSPTFEFALLSSILNQADLPPEKNVRPYLQDRVVLVGAALAGTNDFVDNVVHGRQPGVHLHAMAFDNLLRYGAEQQRDPQKVFSSPALSRLNLDRGEVLEFGCLFVVALLIEALRRKLALGNISRRRILQLSGLAFLFCGGVMLFGVGLAQALHWVPVNVVGLFGFTIADGALSLWSIEGAIWFAVLLKDAGRLAAQRVRARFLKPPPPPEDPATMTGTTAT